MAHEPVRMEEGEVEFADTERPAFDPVAAFNTPGFAEFLAQFDDADTFDVGNAEALETRFNAFNNKNESAMGLAAVLEGELAGHELGIKFGDEAIERHIGERFDSLAVENPEKVNEIAEALREFDRIKEEMEENKAKLAELQGEGDLEAVLEELKKKKDILETAATAGPGMISRFGLPLAAAYEKFAFSHSVDFSREWLANNEGEPPVGTRAEKEAFVKKRSSAREQNDARLALKGYSVEFNKKSIEAAIEQTEAEIKEAASRIEAIEDLERKHFGDRARFAEIRQMLLLGVGTNEELKEAAIERAVDKLESILEKDPYEAQLLFEKMKEVSANNTFGIDYFKGKQDEAQKMLEEKMQERLTADMKKAIEKTPFGNRAYDKMLKSLRGFIEKTKIGTREGEDARALVLETLRSIASEIAATDKAKALLIRFMHVKLQAVA